MNARTMITDRLVLRALTLADLPALHAFGSDPEVVRYTGRAPDANLAATRARFERIEKNLSDGTGVRWGIVRDGVVIGTAGLWNYDARLQKGELGYDLASACWGQGLMTEALTAVLDAVFAGLELHRIEAHIDPDNLASLRVLDKLGFEREGQTRDSFRFADGRFADTVIYGLLRSEWGGGG